jgi:hypothetical protein
VPPRERRLSPLFPSSGPVLPVRRFAALLTLPRHAVGRVGLDELGLGEVIKPVNALRGLVSRPAMGTRLAGLQVIIIDGLWVISSRLGSLRCVRTVPQLYLLGILELSEPTDADALNQWKC